MKETYHVEIDSEDEAARYKRVLAEMKISATNISTRQQLGNKYQMISVVELSKYELLYLRLSIKTGKIKRIYGDSVDENVLHTGTGLHA